MSNKTITLTDTLYGYLLEHSLREPEPFRRLREETARLPEANMQIAPEQGQFMHLLARLINATRVLEVGTFTGYSALWLASALPEQGRLLALDISEAWTAIARRYWQEAGLTGRIELRLGDAAETLAGMAADPATPPFDLAFIDADKTAYPRYYEYALRLLRPGGLLIIDNVLWDGKVADPVVNDADTRALRRFNRELLEDERIVLSMLPVADGITLAMKR